MMKLMTVMPNVTEDFISGLNPFTNYTVKVRVKNSIRGKTSKAVTIVTMAAGICNLPQKKKKKNYTQCIHLVHVC